MRLVLFLIFPCFAVAVLPDYLPNSLSTDRDALVEQYFHLGFTYAEIVNLLISCHGIRLCLRQVKRILQKKGLRRRGRMYTDFDSIIRCVECEIQGSGRIIGYRKMHQRLNVEHRLPVDRESVRIILKELDPEGVDGRRRGRLTRRQYFAQGPNYIWHLDGYDKLKPFGFCVHGAVDGYSRRVLWLEVASSNNDPYLIAHYFIEYIRKCNGVPRIMRGDYGTENVNVAAIQRFLRRNCADSFSGFNSFMYGKSVSNQRIECWWSILRKSNADWWIKFFKDMRSVGLFDDDDPLQVECLRFCFMEILKTELYRIAREWNLHRIRPSRNQDSPPGRPDILYFNPEATFTSDYMTIVNVNDLEVAESICTSEVPTSELLFSELAHMIMEDNNFTMPKTAEEAKDLYIDLMLHVDALR